MTVLDQVDEPISQLDKISPLAFVLAALAGLGWFVALLIAGAGVAAAIPVAIYIALTTVIMGMSNLRQQEQGGPAAHDGSLARGRRR